MTRCSFRLDLEADPLEHIRLIAVKNPDHSNLVGRGMSEELAQCFKALATQGLADKRQTSLFFVRHLISAARLSYRITALVTVAVVTLLHVHGTPAAGECGNTASLPPATGDPPRI